MSNVVPGKLWMYFLEAILVTIPVSLVLLAGYRRTVSRSMRLIGKTSSLPLRSSTEAKQAAVQTSAKDSLPAYNGPVKARQRRLAVIYGLGSLVAAGIMAFLFALSMQFDLGARAAFAGWYVFAWPIIPISIVLLAWPQRWNVPLLIAYALIGAAIIGIWASASAFLFGDANLSPLKSVRGFFELLVRQITLPYLIVLLTGSRRLRPVSPVVLAGLLVFSFGSLFARDLYVVAVQSNPDNPWLIFRGSNTYSLWYFIAALPIGYVCWLGIQRLTSWYERKRFSDVQLLVDSWWLIVVFQFSTELATVFGWGGTVGLLAFVGYRGTVEVGLRLSRPPSGRRGPTLLLLRVFGFQRRTETLFDSVAERWRFVGPVMMIAGADLAMRTLNPGDVVSYVSGKLQSLFIAGEQQIQQAAAALDGAIDPDGRFRTTKFYCRDDTWRPTLTALLEQSDIVLMDLRGFDDNNRGCLFELQELISHELLPRTLFVVDPTTKVPLLEGAVRQQAQAAGKPGIQPLQVSYLTAQSYAELARVYETLTNLVGT